MKKLLSTLLALAMMATLPADAMAEPQSVTVSAMGFGGMIEVTVTMDNGVITAVEAVGSMLRTMPRIAPLAATLVMTATPLSCAKRLALTSRSLAMSFSTTFFRGFGSSDEYESAAAPAYTGSAGYAALSVCAAAYACRGCAQAAYIVRTPQPCVSAGYADQFFGISAEGTHGRSLPPSAGKLVLRCRNCKADRLS